MKTTRFISGILSGMLMVGLTGCGSLGVTTSMGSPHPIIVKPGPGTPPPPPPGVGPMVPPPPPGKPVPPSVGRPGFGNGNYPMGNIPGNNPGRNPGNTPSGPPPGNNSGNKPGGNIGNPGGNPPVGNGGFNSTLGGRPSSPNGTPGTSTNSSRRR